MSSKYFVNIWKGIDHLLFLSKSKIDMTCKYGHVNRLEKLINTMRNHLFMNEEDVDKFLAGLKKMMQGF